MKPSKTLSPEHRVSDMKLEVIVIPLLDVDRAKRFYNKREYAEYLMRKQTGEELPQ